MSAPLIKATRRLARACRQLEFSGAVRVYHPLHYARALHEDYLRQYGGGRKHAVFLGMNPGPWGMGQTGIPFGDVVSVRDYLGIHGAVQPVPPPHAKFSVQGLDCPRREVSGERLWTFFADRYGKSRRFFADFYVSNYCPLLFLNDRGSNLTPDKLAAADTAPLYAHCDDFLRALVAEMQPQWLIGVGGFAEKRLQLLFREEAGVRIGKILHPSPASPAANRGFAATAAAQLQAMGL